MLVWICGARPNHLDRASLPNPRRRRDIVLRCGRGQCRLVGEEPPCPPCPFIYAHTGVITSEARRPPIGSSFEIPAHPDGSNNSAANNGNALLPSSGTVHSFDFGGLTLAEYYGVPDGVVIEELAFVFPNANGEVAGKCGTTGTSSISVRRDL